MKKTWLAIFVLAYSAFAGSILNADGSINKESEEYKKANEECFNGCDYEQWTIEGGIQYSATGNDDDWKYSFNGFSSPQDYLYVRIASKITTDHWKTKTNIQIPVVVKIISENGFKYYMISEGNGVFSWIKNEHEAIYKYHANANKEGFNNVTVLKLSSLNAGSLSFQVIYLNESLNRRYGKKYSIYVNPKIIRK